MKKKVAIVIPSLRGGGAERVMINIVRHINLDKFEVRLIIINMEGPFIRYIPAEVEAINLDCKRVRHSVFNLIKSINEFKPEVILSTLGHLNLLLLGIRPVLKGSPKIIVREANTPSKSILKLPRIKRMLFKVLYKLLYPKSDKIIAQCQEMKYDIVDTFGIDKNKITYIYNPIDLKYILNESTAFNPYKKENINIVSVGRLTFQKGFDILINAFKIITERLPNVHLTILGEGQLMNSLIQQINRLEIYDKVSIIGFKENPYPYLKFSDIYVLSSRWEGFPNILLEALACETKVIATNCKSGPKEILEDGKYGKLVKCEDVHSLAEGIIEIINTEYERTDRAKDFDITNIIRQYEALLS